MELSFRLNHGKFKISRANRANYCPAVQKRDRNLIRTFSTFGLALYTPSEPPKDRAIVVPQQRKNLNWMRLVRFASSGRIPNNAQDSQDFTYRQYAAILLN